MKRISLSKATLVSLLLCVLTLPAVAQDEPPTEISKMVKYIDAQAMKKLQETRDSEVYKSTRKQVASDLLKTISEADLTTEEKVHLGRIQLYAGEIDSAHATLSALIDEPGLTGRMASAYLCGLFSSEKNMEELAKALNRHNERYPKVSSEFTEGVSAHAVSLAYNYQENGKYEMAINVAYAELERLDFDFPYSGWQMLAYLKPSFDQLDREEEYIDRMKDQLASFEVAAEAAKNALSEDDSLENKQLYYTWYNLSSQANSIVVKATLMNKAAPEITVTHWLNTDYTSLDELKGKVVILDFWATWCQPCIVAFPKLREIYAEYKDKGLEIIGVTSFQGSFRDGNINETEISPERELELTKGFIENHQMTWPVVFTEQSVFNPDFGISGIPTFVLIDRQGNIVMMESGSGPEMEIKLKTSLEELLNK